MTSQVNSLQDLVSLAKLLRDSGDKVLDGRSKLRLTPALLSKLNIAFSSISFLGSNEDFQVTSSHGSQTPEPAQIHFLHDFVQKTVGLTISGNGISKIESFLNKPIDLSHFRSLRHLELHNCTQSYGSASEQALEKLSSLCHQLQTLVLIHMCHSADLLWDALAGGVHRNGHGPIWTNLCQLVASYCGLRSLGCGLNLACNLQWLDLSHNMLADADALSSSLAALPKLCYLNLSYNRLTKIPVPSFDSTCRIPSQIQILLLSHNYIGDLSGIEYMKSVCELNLEVNQLQKHTDLLPLRSLYQLHHIKLKGNPLSYHKSHRILTCHYLPPRAVFQKHHYRRDAVKLNPFIFDGQRLSEAELQAVRDGPICSSPVRTRNTTMLLDLSVEPNAALETSRNSGSEIGGSSRKSRKAREAIIEDFDTLEDLPDKSFTDTQITSSSEHNDEHLLIKTQLESVKAQYKEDWLRAQAGTAVQELLGLPVPASASSLGAISSSERPLSSSTPILSLKPTLYHGHLDDQQVLDKILKRSPDTNSNAETMQTSQSTQYYTAEDSDTVLHVSVENDGTHMKQKHAVGYDGDDEDDENQVPEEADDLKTTRDVEFEDYAGDKDFYVVYQVNQGHRSSEEIFLVTSPRQISEVDVGSGRVMQKWPLKTLKSCVLLSAKPCQVQLAFDTVIPFKRTRVYEMDPSEAQVHLIPKLKAFLESRSLSELNVTAFRCMHCSGEFSVELDSKASKECPTCQSTFVFELEEVPLPSSNQNTANSKTTPASEPLQVPESTSQLPHSPSESSIENVGVSARAARLQVIADVHPLPSSKLPRSSVSLESPGSTAVQPVAEMSSATNPSLRRCESDIDIISNPSQSSIEILDDVSRASGTPGRKRSSEERQVVAVPNLVTVPEVATPLSPVPSGLTESSSSGSVTDSVCTAYENNTGNGGVGSRRNMQVLAKSVLKEEPSRENSPRNHEEPKSTLSSSWSNALQDLMHSMSSKISESENLERNMKKKNKVPEHMIHYNYEDFSSVDHRLKLQLHLTILDADEREVVLLLLRGEILTCTADRRFCRYPGILLISSQKVYTIKITGPEEGDLVDRWISRVLALPHEEIVSVCALPWNLGIWISFQNSSTSDLFMIMRDQEYTKRFFTFLKRMPLEPSWNIKDTPSEEQVKAVNTFLQEFSSKSPSPDEVSPKLVVLLCSSTLIKDKDEKIFTGCSLFITKTSLLLNSDELRWLIPSGRIPSSGVAFECLRKQLISNLAQVEADGTILSLQFLDEVAGGEEFWKLELQSESVLEEIIEAIRPSWERLFSIPLQVVEVDNL